MKKNFQEKQIVHLAGRKDSIFTESISNHCNFDTHLPNFTSPFGVAIAYQLSIHATKESAPEGERGDSKTFLPSTQKIALSGNQSNVYICHLVMSADNTFSSAPTNFFMK